MRKFSVDNKGSIWDCGIDPSLVKENASIVLNREEIKFLLHLLVDVRKKAKDRLELFVHREKYLKELDDITPSEEEELEGLPEWISVEYADVKDAEDIIEKLLK